MTTSAESRSSAWPGVSASRAGAGDGGRSGAPFLVVTCRARNEEDILDAFIAFHLSQGADLVLVTDHGSDDGTHAILDHYVATGRVMCWTVADGVARHGEWMTQMAETVVDLGGTWVINADADEFWMPRLGSLRELFLGMPDDIDLVHAFTQDFLPSSVDGFSAERQTVWDTSLGDGFYARAWKPQVAHRAHRGARVGAGNHRVGGLERNHALGYLPIDIFHFPIRSYAQLEAKVTSEVSAWSRGITRSPHMRVLRQRYEAGTLPDYYRRLVDPETIAEGLASGRLVEDTRLAEALARLRHDPAEQGGHRTRDGYLLPPPDRSSIAPPEIARAFRIGAKAASLHTKVLRDETKALRRELARRQRQRSGARLLRRAGRRARLTLTTGLRWARRATSA